AFLNDMADLKRRLADLKPLVVADPRLPHRVPAKDDRILRLLQALHAKLPLHPHQHRVLARDFRVPRNLPSVLGSPPPLPRLSFRHRLLQSLRLIFTLDRQMHDRPHYLPLLGSDTVILTPPEVSARTSVNRTQVRTLLTCLAIAANLKTATPNVTMTAYY